MALPKEPIIFTKATSCIVGPNDDVVLPRDSRKSDWEVELGIVVGRTARYVDEGDALDHVAGYCLVNDVSEREYQLERGGSWDKGKSFDTFGPIGPYLVTAEEVGDPQALDMWLDVNDVRMQAGSTKTDDLRTRDPGQLHQSRDDSFPGRRDRDRHPSRRRHGQEARPDLPESGRRHDPRNRKAGAAAPKRSKVEPNLNTLRNPVTRQGASKSED